MKCRKKAVAVEVEAVQWWKAGDHPAVFIPVWSHQGGCYCPLCGKPLDDIHGALGWRQVCPGDWIVTDSTGRNERVRPDIFETTYEPVTDEVEALR